MYFKRGKKALLKYLIKNSKPKLIKKPKNLVKEKKNNVKETYSNQIVTGG